MAEHALGVEIVTPEEVLFAGAANSVVTATSEGDLTVMADHAELVGDVVPGVVKIEVEGEPTIAILIHGGFLQVTTAAGAASGLVEGASETDRTTRVTILAGVAEKATDIDKGRAEAAKAAAEVKLADLRSQSGRTGDDDSTRDALLDLADAEAALARADLRLGTSAVLS